MSEKAPSRGTARASLSRARTIDSPIDAVWEAWTSKAILERWWSPPGFLFTVTRLAPRVGGPIAFAFVEAGAASYPDWQARLRASGIATSFTAVGAFTRVERPHHLAFRQELRFGPRVRPLEYDLSAAFAEAREGTSVSVVVEGTETKHWVALGARNLEGQLARLAEVLRSSA